MGIISNLQYKMGNIIFNAESTKLPEDLLTRISNNTNFTHKQIYNLHKRFSDLDQDQDGILEKEDFLKIRELEINPLREKIINMFIRYPINRYKVDADKDLAIKDMKRTSHEGTINFYDFCIVLSNFEGNVHNTLERQESSMAKMHFLFNMYDQNHDGVIRKSELVSILRDLVGKTLTHSQLETISDQSITQID